MKKIQLTKIMALSMICVVLFGISTVLHAAKPSGTPPANNTVTPLYGNDYAGMPANQTSATATDQSKSGTLSLNALVIGPVNARTGSGSVISNAVTQIDTKGNTTIGSVSVPALSSFASGVAHFLYVNGDIQASNLNGKVASGASEVALCSNVDGDIIPCGQNHREVFSPSETSGTYETFVVPAGVKSLTIEAYGGGAAGGPSNPIYNPAAGNGGDTMVYGPSVSIIDKGGTTEYAERYWAKDSNGKNILAYTWYEGKGGKATGGDKNSDGSDAATPSGNCASGLSVTNGGGSAGVISFLYNKFFAVRSAYADGDVYYEGTYGANYGDGGTGASMQSATGGTYGGGYGDAPVKFVCAGHKFSAWGGGAGGGHSKITVTASSGSDLGGQVFYVQVGKGGTSYDSAASARRGGSGGDGTVVFNWN